MGWWSEGVKKSVKPRLVALIQQHWSQEKKQKIVLLWVERTGQDKLAFMSPANHAIAYNWFAEEALTNFLLKNPAPSLKVYYDKQRDACFLEIPNIWNLPIYVYSEDDLIGFASKAIEDLKPSTPTKDKKNPGCGSVIFWGLSVIIIISFFGSNKQDDKDNKVKVVDVTGSVASHAKVAKPEPLIPPYEINYTNIVHDEHREITLHHKLKL